MASAPSLRVVGATRDFGARRALDCVGLDLYRGEIYGLLGPNGAGKTTLIRAICGRVRLDAGSVRLDAGDPRTDRGAKRRLGLVPQAIALYPDLTARENLEVLGGLSGLSTRAAAAAAGEALEWTGLADSAGVRAGRLSGGMQRRLNLAAGVLHRPEVLLLDEPTVGIDPAARERIHELLRELASRGTALLLATHDLEQAAELAQRIGILVEGRLRAEGTPDQLRARLGGQRHALVLLSEAAAAGADPALAAAGFAVSADRRSLTGAVAHGLEGLGELSRRLATAGVAIAEIRVREPDLKAVFFQVAGRELGE